MTLENMLRKSLVDPPAGTAPTGAVVTFAHQSWQVTLRPVARDSLSCALNELTVERQTPADSDDPRPWAERIGRTVTGLLEPLKLLEVDAPRKIALLRSATPAPADPGVNYYEVELHGTTRGTVRRFHGFTEAGHTREQVPFTLTHEALAKLIGDVTAEK